MESPGGPQMPGKAMRGLRPDRDTEIRRRLATRTYADPRRLSSARWRAVTRWGASARVACWVAVSGAHRRPVCDRRWGCPSKPRRRPMTALQVTRAGRQRPPSSAGSSTSRCAPGRRRPRCSTRVPPTLRSRTRTSLTSRTSAGICQGKRVRGRCRRSCYSSIHHLIFGGLHSTAGASPRTSIAVRLGARGVFGRDSPTPHHRRADQARWRIIRARHTAHRWAGRGPTGRRIVLDIRVPFFMLSLRFPGRALAGRSFLHCGPVEGAPTWRAISSSSHEIGRSCCRH